MIIRHTLQKTIQRAGLAQDREKVISGEVVLLVRNRSRSTRSTSRLDQHAQSRGLRMDCSVGGPRLRSNIIQFVLAIGLVMPVQVQVKISNLDLAR